MIARWFIMLLVRRTPWHRVHPLTPWSSDIRPMKRLANRYMPFLRDEVQRGDDTIHLPLPWWAPCNALMHHWLTHDDGNEFHDHPRWSITICLKGELIEKTPWGEKTLRPGSVVFRSSRYIHGFRVSPEHSARTWTLFLVGRRKHQQNTYVVTRRVDAACRARDGRRMAETVQLGSGSADQPGPEGMRPMKRYRTGTQWCVWRWSIAPFLTRLHIVKTPWFALCLHWILRSDKEPHEHDHPISFLSILLRGRYAEVRGGELRIRKWFNFIRATDTHRILAVMPHTLTLCLMGPKVREWGYHTPEGWVCWKDYPA